MLFNSYVFLFLFFPLVLAGYYTLAGWHWRYAMTWLSVCSIAFYAWWNPDPLAAWSPFYVLLLLGSTVANFLFAKAIAGAMRKSNRTYILTAGVVLNLALLAYFKYKGLFVELVAFTTGSGSGFAEVALPLAISFYTFIQIAYLVDVSKGGVPKYSFYDYLLFVVFFPHLIAGPIVHHSELLPQFRSESAKSINRNLSIGGTFLTIGLFKKVVIADALARAATPLFDLAAYGDRSLTMAEGWVAALTYTTQLYFDFSGYSDMAIGLSYCFGIRLPLNFNSPYQATSIVDFWRRWHMTLSRFLRDYLYIPLGGSRCGPVRRYANLLSTMILGGLWHGAGISFLLWGFLHGLFLCVNHAWAGVRVKVGWPALPRVLAVALTFFVVMLAWVPFRAGSYELAGGNTGTSLNVAGKIYGSMFGFNGATGWPEKELEAVKESRALRPLLAALFILWVMPNSQRWLGCFSPHLGAKAEPLPRWQHWLRWRPVWVWGGITLVLLYVVGGQMEKLSEFIYYQF